MYVILSHVALLLSLFIKKKKNLQARRLSFISNCNMSPYIFHVLVLVLSTGAALLTDVLLQHTSHVPHTPMGAELPWLLMIYQKGLFSWAVSLKWWVVRNAQLRVQQLAFLFKKSYPFTHFSLHLLTSIYLLPSMGQVVCILGSNFSSVFKTNKQISKQTNLSSWK